MESSSKAGKGGSVPSAKITNKFLRVRTTGETFEINLPVVYILAGICCIL